MAKAQFNITVDAIKLYQDNLPKGDGRTKDIQLIWSKIDGENWVPVWICCYCKQGPITGAPGDDKCCDWLIGDF